MSSDEGLISFLGDPEEIIEEAYTEPKKSEDPSEDPEAFIEPQELLEKTKEPEDVIEPQEHLEKLEESEAFIVPEEPLEKSEESEDVIEPREETEDVIEPKEPFEKTEEESETFSEESKPEESLEKETFKEEKKLASIPKKTLSPIKRKNSIVIIKEEKEIEEDSSSEEDEEDSDNDEEEHNKHMEFQEWFLNVDAPHINDSGHEIEEQAKYFFDTPLYIPSFPKITLAANETLPDALKLLYTKANFTSILNSLKGNVRKKTMFEYLDALHGVQKQIISLEELEENNKKIADWTPQLNTYLSRVYQSILAGNPKAVSDWEHRARKLHRHHSSSLPFFKTAKEDEEETHTDLTSQEIILVFLATILNNKKILLDDKEFYDLQQKMQIDPRFLEFFRGLSTVQKLLFIKQIKVSTLFNTYIVPLFLHRENIETAETSETSLDSLLTPIKPDKLPPINLLVSDFILEGDYLANEREKIKDFLEAYYYATPLEESMVDKIYQGLLKSLPKPRDALLNDSLENVFTTVFSPEESAIHVKTLEQAIVLVGAPHRLQHEYRDTAFKTMDVKCLSCSLDVESSLQSLTKMYSDHKIQHEVNTFRKELLEKYKDDITPKIILEEIHAKAVEQKLSFESIAFLKKVLEIYESLELIPRIKHDYNIRDFYTLLNLNTVSAVEQKNYFIADEVQKIKYVFDPTLLPQVFKELYGKVQTFLKIPNTPEGTSLLREFGKIWSAYKLTEPLENEHVFNELRQGRQGSFLRSLVVLCKSTRSSPIHVFTPSQSKERRAKRQNDSFTPKQIIARMMRRECVNFYDFDLQQTKPWRSITAKERPNAEREYMKKHTPKFEVGVGTLSDDKTQLLKVELITLLEKTLGSLNKRSAIIFDPQKLSKDLTEVFLNHFRNLSLKTMLFQFFLIYNLITIKPIFFHSFFLLNSDKLPYLKVYNIMPEILVSDQSAFETKLNFVIFQQVFGLLVKLKYASPMYKTFLDALYLVNTNPQIFMSSHANQYKNLCENFDTLEGPIVFYYTNQDTEELHGAGFAELNEILNNQESFAISKAACEAIQSLVIPEQTQPGDIFITQTELLRQLSTKLDSPSTALVVDCLKEAANMYEESEKLSPIRKILKELEINTYPLRGLAKEHITTQVLKTFWDKVLYALSELQQTWSKWKTFASDFTLEETHRKRLGQVRADRKTREAVIKKFGLLQHLPVQNIDSALIINSLVDYLTLLLVPESPNVAEHNCDLCNKRVTMKTYVARPTGFEEVWVCNNEHCFQSTLSEDKLPPLSSAHITTGEIRANLNKLFESFLTSDQLHHSSWKEVVLSFDIKNFPETFFKAKSPYIFQLYKRFVLDEHPEQSDKNSPEEELEELFKLEAFKKAVRNSFADIVSIDIMSLVKDLLIPPSTFKGTSELLPIQKYHGLISTQKKWGSSWLPEEIIKERSKLIQSVYDYFIDGGAETNPHKQVNALFENEKFKEALTNVLVLAPS